MAAPAALTLSHRRKRNTGKRLLERIGQLRPEDVDIGLVRTVDQAAHGRAAWILVDARVVDEDVGVPDIDRPVRVELVLRTESDPRAVVVGQPRRAVSAVDRRLIVGKAAAEGPVVVVAIVRTDRVAPRVAEVLRQRLQYSAGAAHDLQLLNAAPAGVLHVRHQVPLIIELMENRYVGGLGNLQGQADVAVCGCVYTAHDERAHRQGRQRPKVGGGRIVEADRTVDGVLDQERYAARCGSAPWPATGCRRSTTRVMPGRWPRLEACGGPDQCRRHRSRNLSACYSCGDA